MPPFFAYKKYASVRRLLPHVPAMEQGNQTIGNCFRWSMRVSIHVQQQIANVVPLPLGTLHGSQHGMLVAPMVIQPVRATAEQNKLDLMPDVEVGVA